MFFSVSSSYRRVRVRVRVTVQGCFPDKCEVHPPGGYKNTHRYISTAVLVPATIGCCCCHSVGCCAVVPCYTVIPCLVEYFYSSYRRSDVSFYFFLFLQHPRGDFLIACRGNPLPSFACGCSVHSSEGGAGSHDHGTKIPRCSRVHKSFDEHTRPADASFPWC